MKDVKLVLGRGWGRARESVKRDSQGPLLGRPAMTGMEAASRWLGTGAIFSGTEQPRRH